MPTLFLVDCSLSMLTPLPCAEETYTKRHLAVLCVDVMLEHFSVKNKLEYVSLASFSSHWETKVPYTRNYAKVSEQLSKLEVFDKTCIISALNGISSQIFTDWGGTTPMQIVLITDGNLGFGPDSLGCNNWEGLVSLPFAFPGKLQIVCLAGAMESCRKVSLPIYEKLVAMNRGVGSVVAPVGDLTLDKVKCMMMELCNESCKSMNVTLVFGHLSCPVTLFPPPEPFESTAEQYAGDESVVIDDKIEIFGFLDMNEIASPTVFSRHLVLPTEPEDSKSHEEDWGSKPAFTVLLHGSLKVEGFIAMVRVKADWFGMLYSWSDSKKRSNLMLSIMEPGPDNIPWIGNLNHLCPITSQDPYEDQRTKFPMKPIDKKSYAQNCVIWIKPSGLQADIQKILRHARKLPEKQLNFYKELNRLRKAAISCGFEDLLTAVAQLLERECQLLPGTAHPDAAMQLTHAASSLKSGNLDGNYAIAPYLTKFSTDHS